MRKKRILVSGEASFLSTGFATYQLELLKGLHATGKYELFELATYGKQNDPRAEGLPWHYLGVLPELEDEAQVKAYHATPLCQFGEWRFEEACLAFCPDVVIDARDWWMLEYQERSPFRAFFHWAVMPTVDAEPQDDQWLATYQSADAVFNYSDWGKAVLDREGGGRIKTLGSAPPGADLESYPFVSSSRPLKEAFGLDPDCLLVGTVMRNQKRKLYPDLLEAFRLYLDTAPPDLARRSFLYLHTSWPDLGWHLPRLLNENGLGGRVLFTYQCRHCGAIFPAFFADSRTCCRRCGAPTAFFPNNTAGIPRSELGKIMGCFDAYVQYANSEGFGMPTVDAASCGVPVLAVDYSAMADVVRKLQGFPIRVERFCRESETMCKRALPDNADFAAKLTHVLGLPEPARRRLGRLARAAVEEHYRWDKTVKIWQEHLDSLPAPDLARTWKSPPQLHQPAPQVPAGLSNDEFVRWGIIHLAGRPELLNSYTALRLTRDLNWGATQGAGMGGLYFNDDSTLGSHSRLQEFNRDTAAQKLLQLGEQKNHWERRRAGGAL
jgi:glycosyltransferase involved in cell wall biosynthesis